MGSFSRQFAVMLRKNIWLKRSRPIATLLEIILPMFFVLLLSIGYWLATEELSTPMTYGGDGIAYNLTSVFLEGPLKFFCRRRASNTSLDSLIPMCSSPSTASCFRQPLTEFCTDRAGLLDALIDVMEFGVTEPIASPSFDLYQLLTKYTWDYQLNNWDGFLRRDVKESLLHFGYLGFIVTPEVRRTINSSYDLPFVKYCVRTTALCSRIIGLNPTLLFTSDEEAEEFSTVHGATVWAIIDFRKMDPPTQQTFTIRMNYTATPWSFLALNDLQHGLGHHDYMLYPASGFSTLQEMINEWLLVENLGISDAEAQETSRILYTPMPTSGYNSNQFLSQSGHFIPLVLTFGLLYSLSKIVSSIVEEKEGRLREAMLIMGLKPSIFYLSWLFINVVLEFLASILAALLARFTFFSTVNYLVLWIVMFAFALQVIAFGFLISVFFSKSRIAAIAAPLLLFITAVPYYAFREGTPARELIAASLLPCTAFAQAINEITNYVVSAEPVEISTMAAGEYSIGIAVVMMLVDVVWYLLLALYLDQVLPSEFGVKRHPLFIIPGFTSWWTARKVKENEETMRKHMDRSNSRDGDLSATDERNPFEEDLRASMDTPTVSVKGLTKIFTKNKKVTAVDNLSLSLYHGEVLSLLGHNGAGKSTTIHMITGMTDPTAGTITAFGGIIAAKGVAEFGRLRQRTGYCPQHNVIWPTLTVRQHLIFFAVLKGCTVVEAETQAEYWVKRVALEEKTDAISKSLSGGQKRKLCVAIAFIGHSELVILDEPTAGMDVHSRRALWDTIISQRSKCATLLCTHFMDEADLLSTRIAIMLRGHLKCLGSSLFLKERLGLGYKLTFVVSEGSGREEGIVAQLRKHQTNPVKEPTNSHQELRYRVDLTSSTADPVGLFMFLENNRDALGIRMMGLSLTNLEEVFISIAKQVKGLVGSEDEAEDDEESQSGNERKPIESKSKYGTIRERIPPKPGRALGEDEAAPLLAASSAPSTPQNGRNNGPSKDPASNSSLGSQPLREIVPTAQGGSRSGLTVDAEAKRREDLLNLEGIPPLVRWTRQFGAQLMKRVHCAKRDRRTLCFQFVLPIIFLAISLLMLLLKAPDQPTIALDMSMYGTGNIYSELLLTEGTPQGFSDAALSRQYFVSPNGEIPCYPLLGLFYPLNCSKNLRERMLSEINSHAALRVIAFSGASNTSRLDTEAYHNASAPHALPQSTGYFFNQKLFGHRNKRTNGPIAPVVAYNHPLPMADVEKQVVDSIRRIISAIFILIPFTFIPANYVTFIVRERSCKAQHLQWVSGAYSSAYWFASYVFDLLQYLVTELLAILVFFIFKREEFIGDVETGLATFVVFLFYGLASIPMSYLASYMFTKHTTAQNVVMFLNFFFGFLLVLAAQIMAAIDKTREANRYLTKVYRIVPSYSLGEAIITLTGRQLQMYILGEEPGAFSLLQYSEFSGFYGGVGTALVYMGITAPVLALVLLIIEWTRIVRHRVMQEKAAPAQDAFVADNSQVAVLADGFAPDPEVKLEAQRIQADLEGFSKQNTLVFLALRKVYGKLEALKGVTYGVRNGEVFALLGANGAGKTTTISIVTGDVVQTSGTVRVCGYDILRSLETVRRFVGYCPQFDALHDTMTPTEHLEFYLKLRGLTNREATVQAEDLIKQLGLTRYKKTPSQALSGGNKRRLSLAIAIAGDPAVVLLDEPSAGMDPLARRDLWTVVNKIASSRSVVLTTHHLEEVEALADRVGIMVEGNMRCIGTLQMLKTLYGGASYEVVLSFRGKSFATSPRTDGVASNVPSAASLQVEAIRVHLEKSLSDSRGTVNVMETMLEANHVVLGVSSATLSAIFNGLRTYPQSPDAPFTFAVNQASLEQTFLHVAGGKNEDDHGSPTDDRHE